MSYRNDLDALAARHAALEADLDVKTKELEAASRVLEDAKTRARLPVLDNIRVATPCRADWNAMLGDDRVRACGSCEKDVYNLSSLTRDEAEALIIAKHGELCVRYFQRTDGTILLADCTVGATAARRRKLIAAGAVALLVGGSAVAHHALRRGADPAIDDITISPAAEATTEHVTGAQCVPPPPPAPPAPQIEPMAPDYREIKGGLNMHLRLDE